MRVLEAGPYRVLANSNNGVLKNIEVVLAEILSTITTTPTPNPSPHPGGGLARFRPLK
jgi:very-short-patch-repair endonuclease